MINTLPQSLIEAAKKILIESASHPMIDVDGVMKHRHNSEGRPIHPTDEGIRNFHKWFGDSKLVDQHGRPQVFYHGTTQDFSKFNPKKSFTGINVTFFSPDKDFASSYDYIGSYDNVHTQGHVMPVYIKSLNPYDHNEESHANKLKGVMDSQTTYSVFSGKVIPMSHNFPRSRDYFQMEHRDVISSLKKAKFDSMYVDERGVKNIAVFSPKNIKSAIGNIGAYDKSTSITESEDNDFVENHYNFMEWKKTAKKHGATIINAGQMAGTPNKVDIWYAEHPTNDRIGGRFFKGKGWNYGHMTIPKTEQESNND